MLVVFISLFCAGGSAFAQNLSSQVARTAHAGAIVPLDGPVLAGKPVTFKLSGNSSKPHWDLGDGATAQGSSVSHTYQEPGFYRVVMGSRVGDTFHELSAAIVRVHTPETLHLPQVLLDTDARNEIDDQHYIGYGLDFRDDALGDYLVAISNIWSRSPTKALYDVAVISMVIGNHLGEPWLTLVEPSVVLGPDQEYRWQKAEQPTNVYIIRGIDHEAMKEDFFNTLNGKPSALPPTRQK